MVKRVLIIDDNNMSDFIENFKEGAIGDGLEEDVVFDFLHLKGVDYQASDRSLDINKVKRFLQSKLLKNGKIDIVACDFDLGDNKVFGLEMVKEIRLIDESVNILMYSGNKEKISKHIVETIKNIQATDDSVKKIKELLFNKIEDFVDREEHLKRVLIKMINKPNMDVLIEKTLLLFPDLILKTGYKEYEGKTMSQISQEIQRNDYHPKHFKAEVVRRGVHHLVEINKKLSE